MPANTTRNTLLRQWELLHLLPGKSPGATSADLAKRLEAAGFKVSKRQVERDLGELYDALKHAITCNNGGVPFGWHWTTGAPTSFPDLTLAEALSLNVVESMVTQLLPHSVAASLAPRFKQAQLKLDALQSTNSTARWVRKVRTVSPALPLLPPRVDANILAALQEALLAEQQVQVRYRAAESKTSKAMRLHPLGLVQRGPVTYIIATAFQYTQPWIFAVHRFTAVERVAESVVIPPGFDLDQYLETGALQFSARGVVALKAEVASALAGIIGETPLSSDQKITVSGGQAIVTATVPNSNQLRYWLLSQGAAVKVLEPTALREELEAEIAAMTARYAAAA